ncbi:hypothetical protein EMCRGX_G017284 [Ephydatia muelleri]
MFDNFSILTANVNPFHVSCERGDEALSNCPAPADTSEQSASKADPAIDGNSSESSDRNKESVAGFDLAKLCDNVRIPQSKRDEAIMLGIPQHPKHFPVDKTGTEFPVTVLRHTSRNGESCIRDYLSWSEQLQALFCFPCRLFSTNDSLIKSSLAFPWGGCAGEAKTYCYMCTTPLKEV